MPESSDAGGSFIFFEGFLGILNVKLTLSINSLFSIITGSGSYDIVRPLFSSYLFRLSIRIWLSSMFIEFSLGISEFLL